MTRIEEMDEFFNFEDATNPAPTVDGSHRIVSSRHISSTSTYDIDLILAHAASDDGSFNAFQNYEVNQYHSGRVEDAAMGEAEDFNDYSRWINGAERPAQPCIYCQTHNLECILLSPGALTQKRICTSCTALSRQCSFQYEGIVDNPEFTDSFRPYTMANKISPQGKHGYTRSASTDHSVREESAIGHGSLKDEGSEGSGKSGIRFSRETVRVLRNWLSIHHLHPYPTEEEKEELTRKTGLTKIQITNWLANARRRGQVKPPRTKSPNPHNVSKSIDIRKRSNPALRNMDPMERWEQSPPEHEPASVTDIAKAVKTSNISSNETSPDSYPQSDDGSVHSVAKESSVSSRNTTHSSHASFGSAVSRHSRGSFGSFGQRGRRRRRPVAKPAANLASAAPRQYQCTFCIETFKTKHDWQRHEKSLHLSLERWVCAPNVSKVMGTPHNCAFCSHQNPDPAHYEKHNYTVCQERSLEERTFYRKDHLRQHLRLVHECQFLAPSMEAWKIAAPQVRSRCGFCGITLDTWAARVDHLAEHFKTGKTMADWKGSWGFESDVQKLVENGNPPYLIHSKRVAAMTKGANAQPQRPAVAPYDLVKAGLLDYANREANLGHDLTDDDLREEAARILLEYKKSPGPKDPIESWFRDIIMCPDQSMWLEDLRQKVAEGSGSQRQGKRSGRATDLDDKESVERYCEFERQLSGFVNSQKSLGMAPTNAELRAAGCRILMEYDRMHSTVQSATAATWFCEQIMSSRIWIDRFRQRVGLPPSADADGGHNRSKEPHETFHSYQTLEAKLAHFAESQTRMGVVPSDPTLQRQARLIIFEVDDPFLQTAADDPLWLAHFKSNHGLANIEINQQLLAVPQGNQSSLPQQLGKPRPLYTLQDAKCYRRLELELSRFVASCMSANAPNPHIPTDEEIRRQARWVIYNDDNPWNQTAVDNEEWLLRFKRSNGLAPSEGGPGLPRTLEELDMHFGGTGLTPPYLSGEDLVEVAPIVRHEVETDWCKPRAMPTNNTAPNAVPRVAINTTFCSWTLESSLAAYVRQSLEQGFVPSDEQLRSHARAVLGVPVTSADDPMLLQKFKQVYGIANQYPIVPSQGTIHPARHASNSTINTAAGQLNPGWVPSAGNKSHESKDKTRRSRNSTLSVSKGKRTSLSKGSSYTAPAESYHVNIDPQLWGRTELTAHMAGQPGSDGDHYMTMQ